MREPVPRFLLDRLAAGQERGTVEASAIYLDIAGFTPLTEALSAHGSHGAELVADIVAGTFDPVVSAVLSRGGSIVNSAGDALLAIFTGQRHAARAAAAAQTIATSIAPAREHPTPYGAFTVAVKLGLASGSASWQTLRSRDGRHAAYVFRGSAIERAVAVESDARPGELVVDASMPPRSAADAPPADSDDPGPDADHEQLATPFSTPALAGWDGPGEFRAIVSMFVAVPEAGLQPIIDDAFELQDRFGGMRRGLEFGDKGGVLHYVWGAPIGFERDADRAVAFAAELLRRHPTLRIGAAYGVTFTGVIGTGARREFAVVGTTMNLAARLMGAAAQGEILASAALATRVRGHFTIEPLGARQMKGISEPVHVHTVRGRAIAVDRSGACFGRERELATLAEALAPLRHGRGGGTVVVAGEAGIGKSTLLAAARHGALDPRWCWTIADPVWRQALAPLRAAARELLDQSPEQPAAENARRLGAALGRYGVADHRDALGALVDLAPVDPGWPQGGPADRQRRTLTALTALLRAAAARDGGLVLVVEDVHWADLETRSFLPGLAAGLSDVPFVLLITTRNEPSAPLTSGDGGARIEMSLGPLLAKDLGRLVAERLGRELAPPSVAWLAAETAGNPFFAEQLALYLLEHGQLEDSPAGLVADPRRTQVPPSVEEVVVARLDDLPRATRQVIVTASVLGPRPDLGELEAVLTATGSDAPWRTAIDAGARRGFWTDRGGYLEFSHAIVCNAAYRTLLISTRRLLHAGAATAIRERHSDLGPHLHRLARHLAGAEQFGQAAAQESAAAERALGLGASREAGDYAADGLALVPKLTDRDSVVEIELRLWLALGAARIVTHGQAAPETKDAYDRASALSGAATHTRAGFQALFGLRTYYLFAGDHETSLTMAERSLAVAKAVGAEDLLVQAELMVGNAQFWVGDLDGTERHLGEMYRRLSAGRDVEHLAGFAQMPQFTAVFPAAMTRSLRGDAAGAVALAEQALHDARAIGHRFSEAMVLQVIGFLHCRDERPAPALSVGDELIELADREGFPVYSGIGALVSGWARARLGDAAGGLAMIDTASARLQTSGTKAAATLIGALIADAHLAGGRPEAAVTAAETALADGRRRRELAFVGDLERLRERARAAAGQRSLTTRP